MSVGRSVLYSFLLAAAASAQSFEQGQLSVFSRAGTMGSRGYDAPLYDSVGGGLAFAATNRLSPYIEISYLPISSWKAQSNALGLLMAAGGKMEAFDLNSGLHVTLVNRGRVQPFAGGGAGVMILRSSEFISGLNLTNSVATTVLATHVSFGTRIYLTKNFGLAPELRIYELFSATGQAYPWRFGGSVFYNFGGNRQFEGAQPAPIRNRPAARPTTVILCPCPSGWCACS